MGMSGGQSNNAGEGTVRHMVRTRRIRHLRSTGAVAAAVALVLATAGCGDDGDGGGSAQESPTASAPAASSPAEETQAEDRTQDEAEVTANWEKFFHPDTSLEDKTKLLENGDKLQPLVQGFADDPRVGQVQAKVSAVKFTSDTAASVTYTLTLKEQVVLPDASGKSVRQDGTWKVSVATLCSLVALDATSGASDAPKPPGC